MFDILIWQLGILLLDIIDKLERIFFENVDIKFFYKKMVDDHILYKNNVLMVVVMSKKVILSL
jgi:hypothetical protein